MSGTLREGEPHPMAKYAMDVVRGAGIDLFVVQETLASVAMSGNRMAEVCGETLDRLLHSKPVSDRYLMGLALYLLVVENRDEA